jgi:hypothetical protein
MIPTIIEPRLDANADLVLRWKSNTLSRNRPIKWWACGIAMLLLNAAAAQGPGYVSVGDYTGTANERINTAIAAAMATEDRKSVV